MQSCIQTVISSPYSDPGNILLGECLAARIGDLRECFHYPTSPHPHHTRTRYKEGVRTELEISGAFHYPWGRVGGESTAQITSLYSPGTPCPPQASLMHATPIWAVSKGIPTPQTQMRSHPANTEIPPHTKPNVIPCLAALPRIAKKLAKGSQAGESSQSMRPSQ